MEPSGDPSVAHLEEDDLALYVRGHLEAALTASLEEHLWGCAACKHRLDQILHFITRLADLAHRQSLISGSEKRNEPRFATESVGVLQVLRPLSFERLQGRIINVSKSGLALHIPIQLAPATLVQLRVGTMIVLGEVRHCERSGNEFRIGLRLEDFVEP